MLNLSSQEAEQFSKVGQVAFSSMEELSIPIIGIIQSFALGGGLELALSCDILIFGEKAKIGLPEVTLGLLPAFGGTQRLSRSVGLYKAKEMIFTGNFYSAQEALDMGLANKVVAQDKLLETAEKMAKTIASRGPVAVARSKTLVHKSRDLNMKDGFDLEAKEFSKLFDHQDSKEGMSPFIEKRKAKFKADYFSVSSLDLFAPTCSKIGISALLLYLLATSRGVLYFLPMLFGSAPYLRRSFVFSTSLNLTA